MHTAQMQLDSKKGKGIANPWISWFYIEARISLSWYPRSAKSDLLYMYLFYGNSASNKTCIHGMKARFCCLFVFILSLIIFHSKISPSYLILENKIDTKKFDETI